MRQMTALVKPASSLCNLRCSYCFYCDEAENREQKHETIMTAETSRNLINAVIDFCGENSDITFMFQGGEPLMAGIDYFKYFIMVAEEARTQGTRIRYSLQTNGTLLNGEFCELFKEFDFLIGVSIDGDEALHNLNRCNSFEKAMNGITLLKEYGISFNVLSVITSKTDAAKLFDFYIENDFRAVQPIYCLDSLNGEKSDFSLDAKSLARFKKRFFNRWFDEVSKGNQFYVRDFDNQLSLLTKGQAEQCGASGRCNAQLVVESDGTCYPCDFYCIDKFKCLNINTAGIADILTCSGLRDFMEFEEDKNELCPSCPVQSVCGGGCKRYRSLYNQVKGYCPQKDFILHAISKLQTIR